MGISVSAGQIALILRAQDKKNRKAIDQAKRVTSRRIVAFLKRLTTDMDKIGVSGHFKNAWQGNENAVWNDAPYAGVIERGARSHGVNEEGQAAIFEWAQKKLGLDDKEARSVVWIVCQKLRDHGQPGTFMVRDNLDKFVRFLQEETERYLQQAHNGAVS